MKDKKINIIIFLFIAFLVVGILGFSYAYFKPNVIGSGKTNVAVSGDLRLNFNDEVSISHNAIYPGDTFTKIFTVTNMGANTLWYAIEWEEYNNTFINGEIHIELTCISYINYSTELKEINGECEGIEEREATEESLKEGIEIGTGITHEYNVTITFIETEENQDYNKGKVFNATLRVVDNVLLTINLGGGEIEQVLKLGYEPGQTIELPEPDKEIHTFIGWNVEGMGSNIEGNTLTVGLRNTTLTASWKIYPLLTVNMNGGNTSQTFNERYAPNSTLSLTTPTKNGNVFTGWSAMGTDVDIDINTLTIGTEDTTLTANFLTYANMYTYTGSSTVIDDGEGNWRIKFLTSGTFTPTINMTIDAFLVGGGAAGKNGSKNDQAGIGGSGGRTATYFDIVLQASIPYSIVVGAGGTGNGGSGGITHFHNLSLYYANGGTSSTGGSGGGRGGKYQSAYGANGGSDGGNGGSTGAGAGGTGQGSTTREFGESTGTLYSGGGGGGGYSGYAGGTGGAGGGGSSAAGATNTGGGGAGGTANSSSEGAGNAGGSGIIVIRKHN